jgi:transposase
MRQDTDLLPDEKPKNTVGRPAISFRKVLDGILYNLRTKRCKWKMLPSEYVSGSTCHRRFQQWNKADIFKRIWTRLLKEYDDKRSIKWT